MAELRELRVAVIATDGFEEVELTDPVRALKDAGARVDIVAPTRGEIQGFRHHDKAGKVQVDRTLAEIRPDEYDAVMLPGGALNADAIRVEPALQAFLRALERRALFFTTGQRQASRLPAKLGCAFTERGAVATGSAERTPCGGSTGRATPPRTRSSRSSRRRKAPRRRSRSIGLLRGRTWRCRSGRPTRPCDAAGGSHV